MLNFTISITNFCKNINSALLSDFSSILSSVVIRKAKFCYSIQRKYIGNYNSVTLHNRVLILVILEVPVRIFLTTYSLELKVLEFRQSSSEVSSLGKFSETYGFKAPK